MFCDVCNEFVDTHFDNSESVICIDCSLSDYDMEIEEIELEEVF